jgi:hypothetical protein
MGPEHCVAMEDSQGVTLAKDREITRAFSHLSLVLNQVSSATLALVPKKLNKKTNPLLL